MNWKGSGYASMSGWALSVVASILLAMVPTAAAQQVQVTLDPAQTKIEWTLGATLHTVHGTFKLKSGQFFYDPRSGNASGEFVVDATSGDSGNHSRDGKMNKDVLESKRYPEITFLPKKVVGQLSGLGMSTVQVQGVFHIHGADHDMTLSVPVQASGAALKASTNFFIPYQDWGMKNPSTLFLRVDNRVQINIVTVGKLTSAGTTAEIQ